MTSQISSASWCWRGAVVPSSTLSVWVDHFSLSVMCTPRNLKLSNFSNPVPSMWVRGVLPLLFPEVHNNLLCFVDGIGQEREWVEGLSDVVIVTERSVCVLFLILTFSGQVCLLKERFMWVTDHLDNQTGLRPVKSLDTYSFQGFFIIFTIFYIVYKTMK